MGDYVALEMETTPSQPGPDTSTGAIYRLMQDTEQVAGVSLVELWVLQEDSKLVRECYQISAATATATTDVVRHHILHLTVVGSLGPAEGVPGILWTETANRRRYPRLNNNNKNKKEKQGGGVLAWRDIRSLTKDPHRIPTERMTAIAQAFQYVAGVPFEIWNNNKLTKGIVLYYVTDDRMVTNSNPSVGVYLASAAMAIGHVHVANQQRERIAVVDTGTVSPTTPVAALTGDEETAAGSDEESQSSPSGNNNNAGGLKEDLVVVSSPATPSPKHTTSCCSVSDAISCRRVTNTLAKSVHGGGMTPPPAMPWQQSFFTLVGALITLALVTKLSHYLVDTHGGSYEIVLGPYGALVTLLFALSAAPAAQPRNAIAGQVISLTIAIAIGQYTTPFLDVWMKQTLATGLSVAAMAKVGVTHPPAGAAAMLFSAGNHTWIHMGMMLVGNVIALASATLVNNWSDKRQYPTYWGFLSPLETLLQEILMPSPSCADGPMVPKQP